ncbi:uncharacterized protein GGS22DRAFT_154307 [Annulohypoxylon maeteangense]|uniref:uncharacterized protein n=1 Tax=Annulohypoxylon maeteangense TaxID=1927788 RepID=UPI002008C42C|nr:uncharacterized protein GGS22DRAFT_154307 [Annulohypoxylon maeteangense]KAI0887796.1 hypothetical protein GGS22DRAFT_154307 [Annulohypoxylon maeteangense]
MDPLSTTTNSTFPPPSSSADINGLSRADPGDPGWRIVVPTALLCYLTLVQVLRFRALRALERKYAAYVADPYALNYRQAAEVMRLHQLRDTPFLFYFGTQWALVKSYGMATGTPLLVKTRQLCDPSRVGRRAEDTAILLIELLCGDLDSERGRRAMARLNWMHERYTSHIVREDYVHTLALFVLEPARWIDRYDWRPVTRMEKVAYLVYWRELARRMGFLELVPETLEALETWKLEYEAKHMYFVPSNKMVAEATVNLFLRGMPTFLHGVMRSLFVSFIDEKPVRESLGFPEPPMWATMLTKGFFRVRGFVVRYFFLPRAVPMDPLAPQAKDGRIYRSAQFVGFEPWYVADTLYNRVMLWLSSGGKVAPGGKYQGRGYVPEELGPAEFEKMGREEVLKQAEAMKELSIEEKDGATGGCPMGFGF